ncbi:heme-copper oxidase subunit III [Litorilinea aerophila]|uniref:Heme-copper oxidase subunit III n=1 Tax=Litorilinea aerophila TaxID=1204385 RepID=A0A540VKB1_9CHLR|nr:heme-copper oxidase subunit III [Litorilinea aerophila]MCC9075240.1 heme-copper oxidase subunit III [Litorilinea aerophila]OUC09287.1 cytochrome oxidase subunit III [Litorilinea aerophila]GIV78381.1 MAG: cytochrome b6 [Litorilinea sp.]
MSAIAETVENYTDQLRNNRLGLWMFFISEAFLFGGLLVTRFYLWGNTRPELDQTIGLIVTSVLLLSSFSMNLAETAMEHGDRKTFLRGLVATAVLGLIFLVGVLVFEWGLFPFLYEGHLKPWEDVYGAVVFAMTGMHALHVVSGIVFIAIVWNLGRKGHYSPERHWGVEACAIYWHYVDLVWIFFYPALYLIGTVAH